MSSRVAKLPKRFTDYVLSDEVIKKKPAQVFRKHLIQDSEYFGRRFSVRGMDASVKYAPIAFIKDEDKALLKRSFRLDKRSAGRKSFEEYMGSTLYRKIMKVFGKVKSTGNDDFLTQKLSICKIRGKGHGVKAHVDLKKGEVIGFYGGELKFITDRMEDDYIDNHYLLGIAVADWYIDAKDHRAYGGMLNHSKDPNIEAYVVEDGEHSYQVGLVTSKGIKKGEELCLNYDDGKEADSFFEQTQENMV